MQRSDEAYVTPALILRWLLFGLVFWGCAELGHYLSFPEARFFATFWPASGLYLAVLAMSPKRHWAGYIAAAVAANALAEFFLHGASATLIAAFCVANTLEAVTGAWLLHRVHRPFRAESLADILWIVALAAFVAPLAGAAIGGVAVTEEFPDAQFWYHAAVWWMADAVGVFAVAPMLLTFPSQAARNRTYRPKIWLEAAVVLALVVFSSFVAFGPRVPPRGLPAYPFVVAPFLLWCGLRFGQFGTAVAVFLAAVIAVWGTTRGYGLFAHMEPTLDMRSAALQVYVIIITLTPLLFATVNQQQRTAEARLNQNLKLLQAVLEGTSDAIFVKDLEGRYLLMNAAGARMLGKGMDEVIGHDDFSLFDEPTAQRIRQEDRRTIDEAQTRSYEAYATTAGWTRRHYTTKGPYRDADGRVVGVVGIARDVTSERLAAETLATSERRFRSLAGLSPMGIFETDAAGRCIYVNDRWRELTGMTAETAFGDGWKEAIHPSDRQAVFVAWHAAVDQKQRFALEYRFLAPDGRVTWVMGTAVPILDEQGQITGFLGNLADITELRQAQKVLEEANEALERRVAERTADLVSANEQLRREMAERARAEDRLREQQAQLAHAIRLSNLGEMAAELAHEVNQPLSAITNYVRGTQRRIQLGNVSIEEIIPTLEIIGKEANRAADVIRRTKNFVRKQPPSRMPLDLGAVAHEALTMVEHDLREHQVQLEVQVDDSLPKCSGDAVQLQQVIVNLMLNAADALRSMPADRRRVRLRVSAGDDSLQLAIDDSGPGIAPPATDRVFEAFFSTKPEGLGLGLPISRGIIESHGGKLWADKGPLGGACMSFTVPVWEGPNDQLDVARADGVRGGR